MVCKESKPTSQRQTDRIKRWKRQDGVDIYAKESTCTLGLCTLKRPLTMCICTHAMEDYETLQYTRQTKQTYSALTWYVPTVCR
jgi:hypothetical protein